MSWLMHAGSIIFRSLCYMTLNQFLKQKEVCRNLLMTSVNWSKCVLQILEPAVSVDLCIEGICTFQNTYSMYCHDIWIQSIQQNNLFLLSGFVKYRKQRYNGLGQFSLLLVCGSPLQYKSWSTKMPNKASARNISHLYHTSRQNFVQE